MSAVILQDEIVHYEVLGRGRPLLFLHSWVGSWRYWIPSMQVASVNFRAYAMDLWGFGDTAKNPAKYTLDQQVALIDDFMEKMGIMKIALVGHGLGAIVSLEYAKRNSELVDRVLAVSFPSGESMINPRLRSAQPVELADWLLSRAPAAEAARVEAPKTDFQAISSSIYNMQNLTLAEYAVTLETPSLYIHGQADPAVMSPRLEDVNALPDSTHHILFEQSGHFPMLDEATKFNRLLTDFLSLPSGISPRQLQLKEEWKRRIR